MRRTFFSTCKEHGRHTVGGRTTSNCDASRSIPTSIQLKVKHILLPYHMTHSFRQCLSVVRERGQQVRMCSFPSWGQDIWKDVQAILGLIVVGDLTRQRLAQLGMEYCECGGRSSMGGQTYRIHGSSGAPGEWGHGGPHV